MATFDELKTEGTQMFGEVGAWAYDEWIDLNAAYFGAKNTPGPIYWILKPQNKSLGCYFFSKNIIYLYKGLVRPVYPTSMPKWCLDNLNKRLASDVLLHEMIHQTIHQTGGWTGESSHNNERFLDEVNRIAKLLGLQATAKVIKSKMIDGKSTRYVEPGCLNLEEISDFPYATRSYDYYYGYRHY
jgi:hypothetical protein